MRWDIRCEICPYKRYIKHVLWITNHRICGTPVLGDLNIQKQILNPNSKRELRGYLGPKSGEFEGKKRSGNNCEKVTMNDRVRLQLEEREEKKRRAGTKKGKSGHARKKLGGRRKESGVAV